MQIDITGYVTEPLSSYHFKVKVTSDSVEHLSLSNFQVSKEVRIYISPDHYPSDYHTEFKFANEGGYRREQVDKCISLSKALREGDQIECSVFIVDTKTYDINRNRRDIETYADFDLWLYPNKGDFRRSESDSRESLKFRKKWRYTCLNREKCRKVTDYAYKYRSRWWINKNPTIIRPILWWIWIKTNLSNLWNRLTRQENPPKTIAHKLGIIGLIVTIIFGAIGLIVTVIFGIIGLIITIWF